jgi:hypothetical protein
MSSFLFGNTLTNEYKEFKYVYLKSTCLKWIHTSNYYLEYMDNRKECTKRKEPTLDDIRQYIDLLKLNDFIKVDSKNHHMIYYNDNYTIKRDRDFLNNVIKLHNDIVDHSDSAIWRGTPYDILRFLVKYTIKHEDKYLFDAIHDMVSQGDGEYAQAFYEETTIPLLLNLPNIDNYLPADNGYASVLYYNWEITGGTIEDYKKMSNQIKKQSLKLHEALDMNLRGMILVMKFKITFDEFNKIIYKNKDVEENTKYFTKLLIKYNLLDELNKYK